MCKASKNATNLVNGLVEISQWSETILKIDFFYITSLMVDEKTTFRSTNVIRMKQTNCARIREI